MWQAHIELEALNELHDLLVRQTAEKSIRTRRKSIESRISIRRAPVSERPQPVPALLLKRTGLAMQGIEWCLGRFPTNEASILEFHGEEAVEWLRYLGLLVGKSKWSKAKEEEATELMFKLVDVLYNPSTERHVR